VFIAQKKARNCTPKLGMHRHGNTLIAWLKFIAQSLYTMRLILFYNAFNLESKIILTIFEKTNNMDIIYFILLTPVAVVVSFLGWKLKQYKNDINKLPEAKPFEFERDQYIPHFDEYTQTLYQFKTGKK
jgi:hypothetical protein